MQLENTWYTATLLTVGSWFCLVVGICAALWITVQLTEFVLKQLNFMALVVDFSIHREEFKEWLLRDK